MKFEYNKLENISSVGDGAHASIKRENQGILYLTAKNFKENGLDLSNVEYISEFDYAKHFVEKTSVVKKPTKGDIVFSIIGSIGTPYVVKKNDHFGLSSSVAIIRPNQKIIISKYLYFWMLSNSFQTSVENIKSGVAQGFLSLGMVKKLPIYLPPLPIQRKIAAVLSAYDDLIENNNRRIAILEKMAEELYREWFVRLRFPGHENVKIVKGVPEGWAVKRMSEVAEVIDCLHTKKPSSNESGEGWLLQLENIMENGRFNKSYKYLISSNDYDEWTKNIELSEGDCLITNVGRIGAVAQIPRGVKAALGRNMTAVRPKKIPSSFLIQYLISPHMKNEVQKKQDFGAIMGALNVRAINKLSITIPESNLLQNFDNITSEIRNNLWNIFDKNNILNQTRDRLLSRLMSGKIDLEKLNIQFPPSMEEE